LTLATNDACKKKITRADEQDKLLTTTHFVACI
jgi:hypothetical protein